MNNIYQIDELKNKLYPIFENAPVQRAILFGSYAKGQATEQSDIDIVVDGQGRLRGLAFYGVLEDVSNVLSKDVDLMELSEVQKGSPIFNEIMDQGVMLYERKG